MATPVNSSGAAPLHPLLLELKNEIATYRRELPRLLAEGNEGRFALIHADCVVSIWDTSDDAYQAGRDRFGFTEPFLAQPIDSRDLTRDFPVEVNPAKVG